MIAAPSLEHAFTLDIELGPPLELGSGRAGVRRIIPIVGGMASGPMLEGQVLNLGADWQTVFGDGAAHLDTRYAIETTDGAIVEVVNVGVRRGPAEVMAKVARGEDVDPASYYMRTSARLETGDPKYAWVNHTLFLCSGARNAGAVQISYFKVL